MADIIWLIVLGWLGKYSIQWYLRRRRMTQQGVDIGGLRLIDLPVSQSTWDRFGGLALAMRKQQTELIAEAIRFYLEHKVKGGKRI